MSIEAAWSAPTSALRIEALARAAVSLQDPPAGCPRYLAALSAALEEHLLPFGSDLYADLFREQARAGEWTAAFLLSRAQRKAEDAGRLRSLALAASDPLERSLLARLAVLDSGDVRKALAVFDLAFPRALDEVDRAALDALCPGYEGEGSVLAGEAAPAERRGGLADDVLDLQLDRMRAVVHGVLLAEVVPAWGAGERRPRIESQLREAATRELAAAGRLAHIVELVTSETATEALERWFIDRTGRFERLSVEDPIEMLYSLRFGYYP